MHRASALRTENGLGLRFRVVECFLVVSESGEWVVCCWGHSQQRFELLESVPLLRAEEAIVAQLGEAVGQDMLEEAADELLGRQGREFLSFGLAILITKGDLAVLEVEDTVVAEGHAE